VAGHGFGPSTARKPYGGKATADRVLQLLQEAQGKVLISHLPVLYRARFQRGLDIDIARATGTSQGDIKLRAYMSTLPFVKTYQGEGHQLLYKYSPPAWVEASEHSGTGAGVWFVGSCVSPSLPTPPSPQPPSSPRFAGHRHAPLFVTPLTSFPWCPPLPLPLSPTAPRSRCTPEQQGNSGASTPTTHMHLQGRGRPLQERCHMCVLGPGPLYVLPLL
jgi:hypothetical protein